MKTLKVMIVAGMLTLLSVQQAEAGDYEVQNVMDDVLYGAGIGGMVGLGLMLLTDSPTNHWNYITRGIGVGIIGGAVYGVSRARAFAQLEGGQIHLGVPMPQLAIYETPFGDRNMRLETNLIGGHF